MPNRAAPVRTLGHERSTKSARVVLLLIMKGRRKLRESHSHALAWALIIVVAAVCFVGYREAVGLINVTNKWAQDLPSIEESSDAFNFAQESVVYANDGTTLLAQFQLEKRDPTTYDAISKYVLDGTVATEDVRFFEHNGVDLFGITRALLRNLAGQPIEGASTITQQLIRNTVLSKEATDITIQRKVREAELAVELEETHSKEEILLMYLNTINYGDGCYGIEAAAKNYFQVSARDLTLAQAAALVGIPQSPTYFNPKTNPDACVTRRNLVLDRMLSAGFITRDEHDIAQAEPLALNPAPDEPYAGIYAYPYFTSYVRDQLLAEGNPYGCSYAQLFEGGLTIYTTIDPTIQYYAEVACINQYNSMSDELDAALVAMDPRTGYVLGMVGGKDFYSEEWNIATQGGRPAGSAFKPFTLAVAIEQGISPSTMINCTDPYVISTGMQLHNFDSINYGIRSIQRATAVSSNTGYYRLAEQVTASSIIEMAHRLGIKSDLPNYPIITLGTENVTPLEMAAAYSTFADNGIKHDPVVITKIVDRNGQTIYEANTEGERVLDERVAGAVTKVLRTVFETSEGTAYGMGPSNGQVVAGKTGTGSEFRDHWLVGYCPYLTCAAWVGNRDYSSTSAYLTAEPLWNDFMSMACAGHPYESFPTFADPEYGNPFNSTLKEQEPTKDAPDVVGKTLEEATKTLSDRKINIRYEASDKPAGTVLSQKVESDNSVTLVVSKGPDQSQGGTTPDPGGGTTPTPDPGGGGTTPDPGGGGSDPDPGGGGTDPGGGTESGGGETGGTTP